MKLSTIQYAEMIILSKICIVYPKTKFDRILILSARANHVPFKENIVIDIIHSGLQFSYLEHIFKKCALLI
jgi:hypothetical protein